MKEKLGTLLAFFILFSIVLATILSIKKFINNYNNYEPNDIKLVVECDEFYYDIDNNSYICSNDLYTIKYQTRKLLDLTKKYQIEAFYIKTSWAHHLAWWNNPKEVQIKKLVIK